MNTRSPILMVQAGVARSVVPVLVAWDARHPPETKTSSPGDWTTLRRVPEKIG